MVFQKGREKTGGRKPGSTNKATTDIKSRIATLIDSQFDGITTDLEQLEPKDRIAAYLKFLEYILPKQREQKIDLSTLTDEQVDDLLNKALNKLS
ncbi:hypothetical protein FAES_3368 [Fibrella aestuarina BUZ 2]|uniref:Uncharacterized protein n=1 Tax=Fibrella aestuarina BUZ 2 TaxID=1166018 RepID=I0KB73_9BACT|nr:hypothetical protein FAES_3368 [Fibrella aestuarina BUZ 2]